MRPDPFKFTGMFNQVKRAIEKAKTQKDSQPLESLINQIVSISLPQELASLKPGEKDKAQEIIHNYTEVSSSIDFLSGLTRLNRLKIINDEDLDRMYEHELEVYKDNRVPNRFKVFALRNMVLLIQGMTTISPVRKKEIQSHLHARRQSEALIGPWLSHPATQLNQTEFDHLYFNHHHDYLEELLQHHTVTKPDQNDPAKRVCTSKHFEYFATSIIERQARQIKNGNSAAAIEYDLHTNFDATAQDASKWMTISGWAPTYDQLKILTEANSDDLQRKMRSRLFYYMPKPETLTQDQSESLRGDLLIAAGKLKEIQWPTEAQKWRQLESEAFPITWESHLFLHHLLQNSKSSPMFQNNPIRLMEYVEASGEYGQTKNPYLKSLTKRFPRILNKDLLLEAVKAQSELNHQVSPNKMVTLKYKHTLSRIISQKPKLDQTELGQILRVIQPNKGEKCDLEYQESTFLWKSIKKPFLNRYIEQLSPKEWYHLTHMTKNMGFNINEFNGLSPLEYLIRQKRDLKIEAEFLNALLIESPSPSLMSAILETKDPILDQESLTLTKHKLEHFITHHTYPNPQQMLEYADLMGIHLKPIIKNRITQFIAWKAIESPIIQEPKSTLSTQLLQASHRALLSNQIPTQSHVKKREKEEVKDLISKIERLLLWKMAEKSQTVSSKPKIL